MTYLMATVWLIQKGSPESKKPDQVGTESQKEQKIGTYAVQGSPQPAQHRGGWRLWVYANSLLIVMGTIFFASWLAQSIAGQATFNGDRLRNLQDPISWSAYVTNADFWSRSLQNWQSEFLAVGSMVALSIYLRQRGSSESKPVGTPHHETATEGE
jgi:hypothetical protein